MNNSAHDNKSVANVAVVLSELTARIQTLEDELEEKINALSPLKFKISELKNMVRNALYEYQRIRGEDTTHERTTRVQHAEGEYERSRQIDRGEEGG